MSIKDWFNKTPRLDNTRKEEIKEAALRFERLVGGGSHVERPPRTTGAQFYPNNLGERIEQEKKITKAAHDIHYTMWNYQPKRVFETTKEPLIRNTIPSHWNKEIKEEYPKEKDVMKEIEWEYSEEGAKELRHLFAMWHLNDEVWQRQRRKAINLAVYGEEDPFNEKPYYHIVTFSDEHGFKLTQYPKHQKEEAHALFNNCDEAWHTPNIILFFEGEEIGHIISGGKV